VDGIVLGNIRALSRVRESGSEGVVSVKGSWMEESSFRTESRWRSLYESWSYAGLAMIQGGSILSETHYKVLYYPIIIRSL